MWLTLTQGFLFIITPFNLTMVDLQKRQNLHTRPNKWTHSGPNFPEHVHCDRTVEKSRAMNYPTTLIGWDCRVTWEQETGSTVKTEVLYRIHENPFWRISWRPAAASADRAEIALLREFRKYIHFLVAGKGTPSSQTRQKQYQAADSYRMQSSFYHRTCDDVVLEERQFRYD